METRLSDKVLTHKGGKVGAYADNTQVVYFLKGTEAHFDRKDFFPLVSAKFKEQDPVLHDLLEEIWGVKNHP